MKRHKGCETDEVRVFLVKPFELETREAVEMLQRFLRSIFRDSLLLTPRSLVWQAA